MRVSLRLHRAEDEMSAIFIGRTTQLLMLLELLDLFDVTDATLLE
jgi:hypothetical protein